MGFATALQGSAQRGPDDAQLRRTGSNPLADCVVRKDARVQLRRTVTDAGQGDDSAGSALPLPLAQRVASPVLSPRRIAHQPMQRLHECPFPAVISKYLNHVFTLTTAALMAS